MIYWRTKLIIALCLIAYLLVLSIGVPGLIDGR